MFDFGVTSGHANSVDFADDNDWDAFTSYTMAWWMELRAVAGGADRVLWSKRDHDLANNAGWTISLRTGTSDLAVRHSTGAATTNAPLTNTVVSVDGIKHSYYMNWNGSVIDMYVDGAIVDNDVAQARAISGNAIVMSIGNDDDNDMGIAAYIGQLAIWRNVVETSATAFNNHVIMPDQDTLTFWDKGKTDGGLDEQSLATGTEGGTVDQHSHAVDTYYNGGGFIMTWDLAAWLPPLLSASGLFGGNLLSEITPVWKAIQKIKGTVCRGFSKEEVSFLIREMQTFRKARVFYASS